MGGNRGREEYYGSRSLWAWEGRGYGKVKALQPKYFYRLRIRLSTGARVVGNGRLLLGRVMTVEMEGGVKKD